MVRSFSLLLLVLVWSISTTLFAQSFPSALRSSKDVDLAASKSFRNGVAQETAPEDVLGVLGLNPRFVKRWMAARIPHADEVQVLQYRFAFTRSVAIGSLFVDADVSNVRLLKNDADYPGDPSNAAQWVTLSIPARQGSARLIPLDAGTKTRAILIEERKNRGYAELKSVRLFAERLFNSTPWSLAYADHEYVPPLGTYAPHPASSIPKGVDRWENAGKDDKGFVQAAPISDVSPAWFMLTWEDAQTVSGLWLDSNLQKMDIEYYVGPATLNPRAGSAAEWRKIKDANVTVLTTDRNQNTRLASFAPVSTRGIRLHMTQSMEGPIAKIFGLHTLTALGTKPLPEASLHLATKSPVSLPVQLRDNDNLSVAVNLPDGRRVRNVVSRAPAADYRGMVPPAAGWDLKDEKGQFVAPGKYQYTALAWPDLETKYEMTVYPNVSRYAPENAPWLTGANGSGGWMADHTPPCSVCIAGDHAYLGSYVAESGVSLIECDLDGHKKWGHHSFAAWTGARFLAADGKTVYAAAPILNTSTESVWAVDVETKKVTNLLKLQPTASRKRGMQGVAAHGGKLYLSVRGQESWLAGATSADDVDLAACLPLYLPKRKPRVAYEVVPDQQGDFVRLFRLVGTPPGGATAHTLAYLESPSSSSPQQHVVLAFKKPVPIGSVALPVPLGKDAKNARLMLSVLKPNASYPPNPEDAKQWTPFASSGSHAWDVVPAPEGTVTRALRISFVRGGAADGDPLATTLEDPLAAKSETSGKKTGGLDFDLDRPKSNGGKSALGFGGDAGPWKGRLEGLKLLRRRFTNVASEAEVRVNSGKVAADGTWDAQRQTAVTDSEPGIFALEWKAPQKVRGLAIKEIDGALTKIDVYTGSAGEAIDIASNTGWENVGEYKQARRNHHSNIEAYNAQARYVDGYVDFGREVTTRAVRLRVVEQWADVGARGEDGVRVDQGAQVVDATRCRVYGVAAVQYLGGEPLIDSTANERVEVYETASGKLLQEVPLASPGEVACNPAGQLFALSNKQIVRVALEAPSSTSPVHNEPIVTNLMKPTDFAFDQAGLLYAFDNAPDRQNIRVYDGAGKLLRTIGTPGGVRAGAWDQTRFGHVTSMDIDPRGQIWAVEEQYHPKRITVWKTDGTFQKEFLGNTPYGGGGVIDPRDKTRLFHGPMEFELDWKTGLSRIKYFHWLGNTLAGEVPLQAHGREYLVTRPEFQDMRCGIVYLYENGVSRMVAAMGFADSFEPLKNPDLLGKLGNIALTEHYFRWSDLNGDGQVQADEVKVSPAGKRGERSLTNFNRNLEAQFGDLRFFVKEYLANGVPVYDEKKLPKLAGRYFYRLNDGTFYHFSENRATEDDAWTVDGERRWSYAQEGWGVQSLNQAKPWTPDQVVSQFGIVGHEVVKGDLGEVFVVHSNHGAWNIWTADGMLVGPLFRDLRDPRARQWSMAEHARGMMMENVTVGQEHFRGYFCRTQDDKYYVVAGHNHVSMLEVLGFEKFRRMTGEFTVTAEDIRKAQEADRLREKTDLYVRSPVIDAHRFRKPPEFDGKLTGFGLAGADLNKDVHLYLGYDDANLYIGCKARGVGPLKNSGEPWERVFKNGAAFDLFLAADPQATTDRQAPEPGDVRLMLTFVKNKPQAVLYRAVVPGTPADKAFRVTSPVGETVIDQVVKLDNARMVRTGDESQYVLEAAIPLADLGLRPTAELRLKMDWGLVVSGAEGHDVLRRVYWANRATQIIADAPSEARFYPHLWGHVLFHDVRPTADEKLADVEIQGTKKNTGKEVKKDVSDILDDLKPVGGKKP